MGSLWFLNFCLKCIDLLAWPLLALGYPMSASIRAIETDSYSETKNLISYWILLSLIYLSEYTFLKLLIWFPFWPYFKLLIVFWLVVPDFGRALYVYNHLVRACIYLDPQVIISRFDNWKKLFVKKENFLQQVEKYIKENGTEALEQLIADKNTACSLAAEAIKAVPATERKEMPQTNGKGLHLEQKNFKDLEMIEKREVPAGKNDNSASCNLPLKEKMSSATETKGMVGRDAVDNELPSSSVTKKVQKEWTCAICQVTTSSEINLNDHLHGNKHRAKCEALKANKQPTYEKFVPAGSDKKTDQSNEKSERAESSSTSKQKNVMNQHASVEQKNPQTCIAKEQAQPESEPDKNTLNHFFGSHENTLTDAMRQKTTSDQSERAESSSTSKQKNVADQPINMEQRSPQANYIAEEQAQPKSEPDKSTLNDAMKPKTTTIQQDKAKGGLNDANAPANNSGQPNATGSYSSLVNNGMEGKTVTDHEKLQGLPKQGQNVEANQFNWTCIICNVECKSERDMAAHLNGRRHRSRIPSPQTGSHQSKLTCTICNVKCTCEYNLVSHLNGRKHLERIKPPTATSGWEEEVPRTGWAAASGWGEVPTSGWAAAAPGWGQVPTSGWGEVPVSGWAATPGWGEVPTSGWTAGASGWGKVPTSGWTAAASGWGKVPTSGWH